MSPHAAAPHTHGGHVGADRRAQLRRRDGHRLDPRIHTEDGAADLVGQRLEQLVVPRTGHAERLVDQIGIVDRVRQGIACPRSRQVDLDREGELERLWTLVLLRQHAHATVVAVGVSGRRPVQSR